MKIKFINHSAFIVEHSDIKLICDPWLEGLAFNNGWSLLSKTQMTYEEFNEITHIWFSHEHPDHFSPPNLLKIPKDVRKNITVLFQETTDRKVAEFCKKIGFKDQIELKENEVFKLNSEVSILCNPYTDGDSYSLIKVKEYKILNLNDCIVNTEEKAANLSNKLGEVDLLFTQFGYANKVGNLDDLTLRKSASKEKLQRIFFQNKFLKPKIIVPFASYIYFCHDENYYMNSGMNKIDMVHSFVQKELKTECIVFYPGDIWEIGESWNSTSSIKKYLTDYQKIQSKQLIKAQKIDEPLLNANCNMFLKKIKDGYPKKSSLINSLQCQIFISDYNTSYTLSGKNGLVPSNKNYDSCDICLGSEALNYCFLELWGGDTLNVNARFQIPKNGNYAKFYVFGRIASTLNRKEKFPISTPTLTERATIKVKGLITKSKNALKHILQQAQKL